MRELVPAWPPGSDAVEHERVEALGGAVDRGGETTRARPDHDDVVDPPGDRSDT